MKKTKEKTGKEQKGVERKQKIEQGGNKKVKRIFAFDETIFKE